MLYFLQIIELKNKEGRFTFLRENAENITFRQADNILHIPKSDFKKEDIIEIYESVKLFGKVPIKRVLRAIN
ncbi:hypothetical protein GCM10011514_06430 [Emticicia aquatilis]|uniref:Uncharacterized protein n=1 Tax=Emticicia aquatilis TaxID=1537369 RepID=A0A916YHM3_9BACT|nr:hypothetical protein [Emticicia aquatilis]GGD45095.1 hypothetical protein GCM10011514_06430 [Emticicia aquatilis]